MNAKTYQHCDPLMLLETVGYDKEIFTDWVSLFLTQSEEQFESVVQTVASGDMKKLEFETHALKGTVGQTGAEKLVEMLIAVESEAHSGHCDCPPERLEMIRAELMAARVEMQHYLDHGEFPEG
ncbi:MAG: Hpt domain-containing protein [Burkholderiales bacterium]|nr:Hpt domain-containing protein [Burkholderiales bacterium]